MNRKVLLTATISVVSVALMAGVLYFTRKAALRGSVIEPPFPAAEISLTDSNGRPFTLSSLRGQVVVIYFGYTHCPDECPLTMASLKLAVDMLGDKSKQVHVVLISTDPARDSEGAMSEFLGKFDPAFVGLVGTPLQLGTVWRDYGVTVENGGETHSNYIYIIDKAGRLVETFLPDSSPADVAADLGVLLAQN